MYAIKICSFVSMVGLAACSSGGGAGFSSSPAGSGFGDLRNGSVRASLEQEINDNVSRTNVGTAAFVAGIDENTGQIVAISGYQQSGNGVGAVRTSGTASYNTRYVLAKVTDISRTPEGDMYFIAGEAYTELGRVTLYADFDDATLEGNNSTLIVDGMINGANLDGNVYVVVPSSSGRVTVATDLEGQIGNNGVIGAFHGTLPTITVAGGFVGTRN